MHPPDGPPAPLPGAKAIFRILPQGPFPPMLPTGDKSKWNSDYLPPWGYLRKWEIAE